jgi:hypothetical protein
MIDLCLPISSQLRSGACLQNHHTYSSSACLLVNIPFMVGMVVASPKDWGWLCVQGMPPFSDACRLAGRMGRLLVFGRQQIETTAIRHRHVSRGSKGRQASQFRPHPEGAHKMMMGPEWGSGPGIILIRRGSQSRPPLAKLKNKRASTLAAIS